MGLTKLDDAVAFAVRAHSGQWRDGDVPLPYISHPLEVASALRYLGGVTDSDVLCAAVLHDTLEHTATEVGQLEMQFGPRVAALVVQMTRVEPSAQEIAGLEKEAIWLLRHERMMREIETVMSPEAQAIKLSDRLSNLRAALVLRKGKKLARYRWQSREILSRVPKSVCRPVWSEIDRLLS